MRSLFAVVFLAGAAIAGKDVQIAAAANLSTVLPELVAAFERAHPGVAVGVSFGASGQLAEQVRRGAPYDVFLAASPGYVDHLPPTLVRARATFALGRLVLYVPQRTGLTPRSLESLTDPRIRRIALASPDHAPFGRAAVSALQRAGIFAQVEGKLIFAANASQAAQMTLQGADAGLIALSSALHPTLRQRGAYWTLPTALHPPLEQVAALLGDGPAARDFQDFLQTEEAREILSRHGFETP